ncbi:MAG: chemotaxis protein CheW [Thermosulfidibacteraceae bacterium]|jgi:purine-binding chemotaxis protein CheW
MDFMDFYKTLRGNEKAQFKDIKQEKIYKFISFMLGRENYGIDMLNIKEIIEIPPITRVPKVPSYVLGVINLRGYIVPVVDLKKRFNIYESMYDESEKKIIVLEGESKEKIVGILVDRVNEVVSIEESQVELPSNLIAGIDREFISRIGKLPDGKIIIILDTYRLIG